MVESRSWLRRPVVAMGIVAGLLILAAATIPGDFALARKALSSRVVLPDTPWIASYLELTIMAIGVAIAAAIVLQAARNPRSGALVLRRRLPLWVQLLFVIGALFLPVALAVWRRGRGGGGSGGLSQPPPAQAPNPNIPTSHSQVLGLLEVTLLVLVIVFVVGAIVLLFRRARAAAAPDDPLSTALVEEIDTGLEDLAHDPDPRAAVIACYARM